MFFSIIYIYCHILAVFLFSNFVYNIYIKFNNIKEVIKMAEDKFVIQKTKNTNRRIIIRTTDEMADEIFSIAKENDVSVNTLLVNCIRYALDHR